MNLNHAADLCDSNESHVDSPYSYQAPSCVEGNILEELCKLFCCGSSGVAPPAPRRTAAVSRTLPYDNARSLNRFSSTPDPHSSLSSFKLPKSLALSYLIVSNRSRRTLASPSIAAAFSSPTDESEKTKLAQLFVMLLGFWNYEEEDFTLICDLTQSPVDLLDFKLKFALMKICFELFILGFKRLEYIGISRDWEALFGQLVCTVVAAVILSFSIIITGKVTSPATFYATAGGIAAAFIPCFGHLATFGYLINFGEQPMILQRNIAYVKIKCLALKDIYMNKYTCEAPPRADVVRSLKNGIGVNLLGMGAAILGMQATVGLLVAKALTTSATPYYQGIPPGNSPVLALDVFLVQASANTILSHFLGLVCSLELLRSVTLPPSENVPIPKMA
ncbi:UNVERIFIED_CONTAM: protein, chloroplastic [Sesamum latifolium]|uniref:Protein, chloroplastic n=1 Tax=Sesamum latifolium TaxID=2727402 RepID=A0AAW2UZT8_9LAMI